jgi:hypothetical protein
MMDTFCVIQETRSFFFCTHANWERNHPQQNKQMSSILVLISTHNSQLKLVNQAFLVPLLQVKHCSDREQTVMSS